MDVINGQLTISCVDFLYKQRILTVVAVVTGSMGMHKLLLLCFLTCAYCAVKLNVTGSDK